MPSDIACKIVCEDHSFYIGNTPIHDGMQVVVYFPDGSSSLHTIKIVEEKSLSTLDGIHVVTVTSKTPYILIKYRGLYLEMPAEGLELDPIIPAGGS